MYDKFKKIISENYYTIKSGVSFFYNSKGANTSMSDDIYIDCQPVGKSEETIDVVNNSSSSTYDGFSIEDLKNNDVFKFIIGVIIFLIIIYFFYSLTSISKILSKGISKSSDILGIK